MVKVIGRGQRSNVGVQRSMLGLGLPGAAKGNYRHVWSKEWLLPVQDSCVCL